MHLVEIQRVEAPALPKAYRLSANLRLNEKEAVMNWDTVKGQWKQVKGKVKEKWGKLTDDDLEMINGKKDQLVGQLQQRYGYAKDQAEREVDDFCRTC
jgi:uncharacterized protein YjbJ (UPF0337 family)